ncbi:peptidase inhibitor family I36 protein [Streptomyces sp. NPDC051578]|uniref:peptidase inhibitor family I36 protein n=1 Tax=Streptomyces sp. NPDC051578 TaxID=3365662 RepID=UPI0037BD1AA6
MTEYRRVLRFAAAPAVLAGALLVATASPASAWVHDGYLEQFEFGLYWDAGSRGCVFDSNNDDASLTNDYFTGPSGCGGRGQKVNDNTYSYKNLDINGFHVYTDINYSGIMGSIPAGYTGDASQNFKNSISSLSWY